MNIDWTAERVGALIALWDEGITTSEIGRRLGVTKNAVVGKVHRLGLPKRQSPIQVRTAEAGEAGEAKIVGLEMLRPGMCSWPDGDPAIEDLRFCGRPAIPDKPYCAAHCAKAYVKNTRDRKRAAA